MTKILILSLGGTIDGEAYSEEEGQYPVNVTPSNKNAAFKALTQIYNNRQKEAGRLPLQLEQIQICNKDSKDIDDNDISKLLKLIQINDTQYDRIVVTIGTDRMSDISRHIRAQTVDKNKPTACPVVFTGSIWPLANGIEKSDGFRNLELAAYEYGNTLTPDIYIATQTVFCPTQFVRMQNLIQMRKTMIDGRALMIESK